MLIHTTFIIIHFGSMLCMFMSRRVVNVGITSTQWLRRCGRMSTLVVLRKSWPRLLQCVVLCALYSPPPPHRTLPRQAARALYIRQQTLGTMSAILCGFSNTWNRKMTEIKMPHHFNTKSEECFNFHTPAFAKRWCLANWTRPPRWLKFSFSSSATNNLPTDWWNE